MRTVLLIFFIFLSQLTWSQNYSGQYPGAVLFYSVNSGNKIITIKEDSSYILGNGLMRAPQLLLRNVWNEQILDTNCFFWGSPECNFKYDSSTILGIGIFSAPNRVKYVLANGDSLTVKFNIAISDTQTVFQNSSEKIKYQCIAKDTATIFGVTDSLITFQVIHLDNLNNPISSTIEGMSIVYSKNVGLYHGFSLDDFPLTFKILDLEGIRNPDYGFRGLSSADLYDFQPGDQYEMWVNAPPGLTYYYEIINRTDSPSQVTYDLMRISHYVDWQGTHQDTLFVQENYSKQYFIDMASPVVNGYFKDTSLFNGCFSGAGYLANNSNGCQNYCPSSNCFGDADCYMFTYYSEVYLKGMGLFYGNYNTIGGSWAWKSLRYFDKQNSDCGSSFILENNDFYNSYNFFIYPNPTLNFITVQSEQPIPLAEIEITDLSGRIILELDFNQSLQIDLTEFSNGIYLIKLYSDENLISTQKLVKQ